MFRRLVAFVVLVGFIASQWAAVPHAHGAAQAPEHTATPHFHLWSHCHDHAHGHSHGHEHHTHHATDSDGDNQLGNTGEHDATAIYVPAVTADASYRQHDGSQVWQWAKLLLPVGAVSLIYSIETAGPSYWQPPSNNCAPACALFLTLRTLRI